MPNSLGFRCGISAKNEKWMVKTPCDPEQTLLSGRRAEGAYLYFINFGIVDAPSAGYGCWPHGHTLGRR